MASPWYEGVYILWTLWLEWDVVCQLFEDVVSVLDPEMLEHSRDSSDEMSASCSDISSTDRPAIADEHLSPEPQPEHDAKQ